MDYTHNIGKYEVTSGQYTDLLNAVAATDTYELCNTNMWSSSYGCKIERYAGSGTPGNPYQYRVANDATGGYWADRPVNYVSYWDAGRFANWLHNGQPNGAQNASTTERGAYTLDGYNGSDGRTIQRNPGWNWAVTSEDEWYKAAYHYNDGVTGDYFGFRVSEVPELGGLGMLRRRRSVRVELFALWLSYPLLFAAAGGARFFSSHAHAPHPRGFPQRAAGPAGRVI